MATEVELFGHFPRNCATGRIGRGAALKIAFLAKKISNYKREIEKSAYNAELLVINQGKIIKSEI
jgi:hypothetical protein